MSEMIQPPQDASTLSDTAFDGDCRRSKEDRRSRSTGPLDAFTTKAQRRHFRRAEDKVNAYVDRYSLFQACLIVSVVILSCMDAFFTLRILEAGGEEVNPVMLHLMGYGITWFVGIKILVTSLGVLFLVVHKNFVVRGKLNVTHILYFFFFGYLILIQYELILLGLAS